MLSPTKIDARLERILPTVAKPGRYTGGEYNQVVKDWEAISLHVALVFPDIYDIGMSNLGLAILYDQINQRTDALAERAYQPWLDMETAMREKDIPLYSLETHHALADFDLIGFSLPYETLYTNTLNTLDLAGIPLFSTKRSRQDPIIIAGGHATYNPEPMHAFIDAFVIGEGEDVIHEILEKVKDWKFGERERSDVLRRLAEIDGVYVPQLYEVNYHQDGTFSQIRSLDEAASATILKRLVPELPPAPTNFIVPYIDTVHNRIPVEIMRGCTRGCRFCHAGMITRPIRERPIEQILETIEKSLAATGFEDVGLLSLSSSDYTHVLELVQEVGERFGEKKLGISLPSLRIESTSIDLMDALRKARRGGFTLAPEAATERMRQIINKPVSTRQLLDTVREIYSRGWVSIKLYFMIGHPSETLEDIKAIADLCKAVLAEGRKVAGKRVQVHVGVSTFVPKPHTPFQWVSCETIEQIEAKQRLLKDELRTRNIKLSWTKPEDTLLEAWLSRGDRRMAEVIYRAWQNGAKFDAWGDQFRYDAWTAAFEEIGLDKDFYTHRARSINETFPWEHINPGIRKKYLIQDYEQSLIGQTRPDCREQCFACGILPMFADIRREHPGDVWKCPDVRPKNSKTSASQTKG